MPLTDEQKVILEKRGVPQIRLLLHDTRATGYGVTSDVLLGPSIAASRNDVEDWLSEKDAEAVLIGNERHNQVLCWTKIAAVAAVAAVFIGLAAIYVTIRLADRPPTPSGQHAP